MQIQIRFDPTRCLRPLAALALAATAFGADAAAFTFSGNVAFNTDVVRIGFTLARTASDVKMWTDSWNGGANFDPTGALWAKSGRDYSLLLAVDDDGGIAAGQGAFDTGAVLSSLAAGSYLFTVAASPNDPAGTMLSQGFVFDGSMPIPLSAWEQPGNNPNTHDQKGTFWRVNFSGVDAAAVVPEPSSWALAALGLGALLAGNLRRHVRTASA